MAGLGTSPKLLLLGPEGKVVGELGVRRCRWERERETFGIRLEGCREFDRLNFTWSFAPAS